MPWFEYQVLGRHFMPQALGRLLLNGRQSGKVRFIVDSGAAVSIAAPHELVPLTDEVAKMPEQPMDVWDVNGKPLKGSPVDFDVTFTKYPDLPPMRERFWVCSSARYTILGQTWFERHAVRFHNFSLSAEGRRFAMDASTFTRRE